MNCKICGKELTKSISNTVVVGDEKIIVCAKHYGQLKKFGKFLDKSTKRAYDLNDFKVVGEEVYIYTTHHNGDVSGFFIIDKCDLDNVIIRKWRMWKGRIYTGNRVPISITKYLIPNTEKGMSIDHINQNPFDNRRCNLRVISQQANTQNRSLMSTNISGFAGIWFDKSRNKWCSEIKYNYLKCFLGRYDSLEEACYVRYEAECIVFGEYRSTTNDKKLLPLVNNCTNKDSLKKYVSNKLQLKYQS